ncbi:hypothetical protein BSF42_44100 [Flavobacterium sp. ACN6]|nr:hypothetical protein BSF42_44100 [Flavobacterium sp. ACN6]
MIEASSYSMDYTTIAKCRFTLRKHYPQEKRYHL